MLPEENEPANLVSLRDARERAIALLTDAFAHGTIEVEEFERRLTLAHQAGTLADIAKTLADIAPPDMAALPVAMPLVGDSERAGNVAAIFGGVERHGSWRVPARLDVTAVMGGVSLDFREAILGTGVTELRIVTVMGGVELIVPPGLAVDVSGTAIMGGFGHVNRSPAHIDPTRPLLRVHGVALMGGVSVETRLPGDSEVDARRRRHNFPLQPGSSPSRHLPARLRR